MPVHQLQCLLGHQDIHSTLHYVHWVLNYCEAATPHTDLIAALEVDHDRAR
jgi:site-specific recombinase XerD